MDYAQGGLVAAPDGRDTIPVPFDREREQIITAATAREYGRTFLDALKPNRTRENTVSKLATIGRIVHYKLNQGDADIIINKRRADFEVLRRSGVLTGTGPGWQARVGNGVNAGDVYPAMVVRRWGDTPESCIQLQVFLDGNDTYWATSVNEGDGERQWSWPPRV